MAFWSRVTGLIAGGAVARAAADGATPVLEPVRQHAWKRNKLRVLDLETAAQLVAQAIIDEPTAEDEAARNGFGPNRLKALVHLTQTAPDLALVLELWRRGLLGEPKSDKAVGLVEHAFAKHQIEPQYWPALEELFSGRLDPNLIATMVQRSVLKNAANADGTDTLLPFDVKDAAKAIYDEWNASTENQLGTAAQTGHNVTPMPGVGIDPIAEARAHGIDFPRLAAETRIVGLPASPDLAARMVFREIITAADFAQAAAEGNTRIEWAPAMFEGFREILTANQYAELQLRGYYDRATRLRHTLKHGMSEADSDHLYDVLGRGLNLHAAFVAERRGGVFEGPTDKIPDWAMFQLQRGNLRPEVYNLAWAGRHSYPSAFVIRALLTGGALSADDGYDLFLKIGWPKALARQVADFYGKASTTPADPHVTKAANQLWTATHSSYVKDRTDDTTAETKLAAIGVEASAIPQVLALWQEERELQRAGLSAAQIKKAYSEATFTQPEAVARLVELGWSTADATVYLGE